jgi:cell wall-associated NlpC family hydrolase
VLAALATVVVICPGTAAYADPSLDQIQAQIDRQSDELEQVIEDYNKTGEELKAAKADAAALAQKLEPLRQRMDEAQARVSKMAAEAYKGRMLAEFTAVLSAPDPSVVVDRLVTLGQLSQYENANMAAAEVAQATHDVTAARVASLIADQEAKQRALAAEKDTIGKKLKDLYALRTKAYGQAQVKSSGAGTPPPYVAGKAGQAVKYAYAALGKPYSWGAAGPNSYDCSGLTMAAWNAAGVALPHNAEMQWNALPHISRAALQPGDLVFYRSLGHVAIFVGSGNVIHAPRAGDVVRIASVDMMTPYGYARPS